MNSKEEDIAWLKSTFHPIPKPTLPDDCIEYSLYIIASTLDQNNPSETRLALRDVQKYANEVQKQWLKDYIWQRQSFGLELCKENGEVCMPIRQDIEDQSNTVLGLNLLRGRTEYGDSIEDEWVVVWLLRELTKKFPSLWTKVTDSDGEFLLIEASGTLPEWLEPEVAENRVWINSGQLKVIKPTSHAKSSKRTDEKLGLEQAHQIILSEPKRIMHSATMEEEAFYRLRNYPGQIKDNMHHAMVRFPRRIAYLVLHKPAYVSPAIEAFYLRDPISLKPLQSKDTSGLTFPPTDLVTLSVRFPRVAYAQLKSQDFEIPEAWKSTMPSQTETKAFDQAQTGMKLACGFEMLLSDSHYQDRPAVREMQLLLSDLESGDATLPSDSELAGLEMRTDDEKWLDINFDDLQAELDRTGQKDPKTGKKAEFGDKAAQENLQRIVKQFEDFLKDDKMGDDDMFNEGGSDTDDLEDIDSDDLEEDKEASFGEDEFTKIMQEMMGMPPEAMKELMSGKIDADPKSAPSEVSTRSQAANIKTKKRVEVSESDEDEDDDVYDDEHIQDIMKRMGDELRASGALDLESTKASGSSSKRTITSPKTGFVEGEDSSDDGEEELNDIDEQLAKNLLQSFQAQGGMSGPASNLMALWSDSSEKGKQRKGKGAATSKK